MDVDSGSPRVLLHPENDPSAPRNINVQQERGIGRCFGPGAGFTNIQAAARWRFRPQETLPSSETSGDIGASGVALDSARVFTRFQKMAHWRYWAHATLTSKKRKFRGVGRRCDSWFSRIGRSFALLFYLYKGLCAMVGLAFALRGFVRYFRFVIILF